MLDPAVAAVLLTGLAALDLMADVEGPIAAGREPLPTKPRARFPLLLLRFTERTLLPEEERGTGCASSAEELKRRLEPLGEALDAENGSAVGRASQQLVLANDV